MATYDYLTELGVIVPDTSTLLTEVQQEYKDAFQDQNLVVTSDTPQGVLITAETISRDSLVNNNANLANQINPNVAGGTFLDAIGFLSGIQRNASTPSRVSNVTLTGVPSTVIPAGSQAKTAAGDIFESITIATLNGSGNATVDFQSVEDGAIPCSANELNQIVSTVIGWETVNNSAGAVLGTTTQSDESFRAYRNNTLAFQGVALPEAITSALYATDGVQSLFFQENVEDTTQTINGISMISHSIYVCVKGGTDLDVASAILENKSSGCGMNGGTSVTITEPASGQDYTVKFDRPSEIGILVKVYTTNGSSDDITQGVVDYANGLIDGLDGFTVGSDVSPFEISGALIRKFPSYYISKVEVSYLSPISYTTNTLPIAVNEIAYTESSFVTVVVA